MIRNLTNLVRGALIGAAEAIPGVSGGTVALVVGIYESLILSVGHVLSGVKELARGRRAEAGRQFGQAHWRVVVPALIGMAAGLLTAAKLLEPLVTEHEQATRAVFFGMVLVSLLVPFRMVQRSGGWGAGSLLLGVAMAALTFFLTGAPSGALEPSPLVILPAAAVAICALVLPGVSGSFLLLTVGLYEPTLEALNNRDLGYLAMFACGAIIGLAVIVKLLQWLLEHHRHGTLVVVTGLMAGSLRALWPWQDADRTLRAPDDAVATTTGLFLLGAAIVGVLVLAEYVRERRQRDGEQGRSTQLVP